MLNKKSVSDIEVAGKKVLVRCDFNVPVKDGVITSDKRIVEALPTIKYLKEHGAKIILCSHFGKPHNVFDAKLKLNKKEIAATPSAAAVPQAKGRKAAEDEIYAAIVAALEMWKESNQLHDEESFVLTIAPSHSAWNDKHELLTKLPRMK